MIVHKKKIQMELTLNPKSLGTFVRIRQFFIWISKRRKNKRKIQGNQCIDWRSSDCQLCVLSSNWIIYQLKITMFLWKHLNFLLLPTLNPFMVWEGGLKRKTRAYSTLCQWIEIDTLHDHQQMTTQFIIHEQTRTRTLSLSRYPNHHFLHFADTFKVQFRLRVPILLRS